MLLIYIILLASVLLILIDTSLSLLLFNLQRIWSIMIFKCALIFMTTELAAADLTQLFQPSSCLILITIGWMNYVAIYTDYEGLAGTGLAVP